MAVALATLPLSGAAAGGEGFFSTGTALTGAATGREAAGVPLAGLAATFFTAGLDAGFTAFFATAFCTGLATGFFATGFAVFFTAGLRAGAGFLAGDFFAAGFFATGFFTAGLATFFAAGFFATVFFAGAFAAGFAFTAAFGARAAAAFALPDAASRDRADALPFEALPVVELRVTFAIFLHHFWSWRPGVIAHVSYTGKPDSGILATLPAASCSSNVNVLTRFLLFLLRLYKRWLSPLLGQRCRFYPSCSDYARIAVSRFGPWRGCLLTAWRLLRCQPLCEGGADPVPEHFHFRSCRSHGSKHAH